MAVVCVLLSLLLIVGSCVSQVTVEVETSAIATVTELIANFSASGSPINNPAAKLVRLAFHDCPGGCDGCLNLQNMENNGLMGIYDEINRVYTDYANTGMSRADFVALAGTIAIRHASMGQDCRRLSLPPNCVPPMPSITLKYGRKDCATSPSTTDIETFPDAQGNLDHVLEYFRTQMNMTERDTVAIIGAHSLGMARVRQSGFNGPWAPPTTLFDNGFFRELAGRNRVWSQMELNDTRSPFYPEARYQWSIPPPPNGGAPLIMLNTDMALFKNIDPDDTGLETNDSCRMNFNNCPTSPTAAIVLEFSANNTAFMEAFGPAFQKMVQTGYNDNELLTARAVSPSPSATPTPSSATSVGAVYLLITFAIFIFMSFY